MHASPHPTTFFYSLSCIHLLFSAKCISLLNYIHLLHSATCTSSLTQLNVSPRSAKFSSFTQLHLSPTSFTLLHSSPSLSTQLQYINLLCSVAFMQLHITRMQYLDTTHPLLHPQSCFHNTSKKNVTNTPKRSVHYCEVPRFAGKSIHKTRFGVSGLI